MSHDKIDLHFSISFSKFVISWILREKQMSRLIRDVFAANRTSLGLDNDQRTISNTRSP